MKSLSLQDHRLVRETDAVILRPVQNISRQRKNVITSRNLCASLSIRIEKIKLRKVNGEWVNGQYVPQSTKYGYRFTDLPTKSMTLNELRELHYTLGEFLKNERE